VLFYSVSTWLKVNFSTGSQTFISDTNKASPTRLSAMPKRASAVAAPSRDALLIIAATAEIPICGQLIGSKVVA